jgi:hypothetical protein
MPWVLLVSTQLLPSTAKNVDFAEFWRGPVIEFASALTEDSSDTGVPAASAASPTMSEPTNAAAPTGTSEKLRVDRRMSTSKNGLNSHISMLHINTERKADAAPG